MSLPSATVLVCNYCGQERQNGWPLAKCSRCRAVLYCDRTHQVNDWPRHKRNCIVKREEDLTVETPQRQPDSLAIPAGLRKSLSQRSLQDQSTPARIMNTTEVANGQEQPVFYLVTNPDLLATPNTNGLSHRHFPTVSERTLGEPKFSSSWSDSTLIGAQGSLKRTCLREVSSFPTRISHPVKFSHADNLPLSLAAPQCPAKSESAHSVRVKSSARHVAQSLLTYGWSVMDNFLGSYHAEKVLAECAKLYESGSFADGQLMRFRQGSSSKQIRSDKIFWTNGRKEDGNEIQFLISMMDAVIVGSSHSLAQVRINGRSRAMIACYPGSGTHYVTHVDNPDRDGRCITAIYYLNANWRQEDGGGLKLYPETATEPVELVPLFDRLLLFWSDRRNPHEVLPVFRNRFAITVWYYDAVEKAAALEREGHGLNQKNVVDRRFHGNFAPTLSHPAANQPLVTAASPQPAEAYMPSSGGVHTSVIQQNHTGNCSLLEAVSDTKMS